MLALSTVTLSAPILSEWWEKRRAHGRHLSRVHRYTLGVHVFTLAATLVASTDGEVDGSDACSKLAGATEVGILRIVIEGYARHHYEREGCRPHG